MTDSVPVLLVTGPIGAGKTTAAEEAGRLVRDAGMSYARFAFDHIGVERALLWIDQWWSSTRLTWRHQARPYVSDSSMQAFHHQQSLVRRERR